MTLSYIKSVTDNIRQKYDQSKYDLDVDGLSALSMGVAVTTGGGRNSMHSFVLLYKKADKALYYTKQHGKASCSFYNELIEQGKKQAGEQAKADLTYLSDYVSQRLLDGDSGPGKTEYELIYQIIRRGSVLQYKRVELVLFTLVEVDTGADGAKHVDGVCMERLKRAIGKSLRRVDFDLKYSDNQYLVMLMGTTVDVAGQVASRIADHYYSLCGDEYAELVYDAAILRLNL